MSEVQGIEGIGLADAIGKIKAELAQAMREESEIRFPVTSVTVELKVIATKSGDANAGFKIPLINLELGASGALSQEHMHTITVALDTPVDKDGNPLKVTERSENRER